MIDNILYISRIKFLISDKKVTAKKLAEEIGISEIGLHKMLNNNDMKVSTLINIANYFKVPVSYFFNDAETQNDYVNIDDFLNGLKKIVIDNLNKK